MGISNDQTETVRAVVLLALLLVFGLVGDPLFLWFALTPLGVGLGEVYASWLFLVSLVITVIVFWQLLVDQDKSTPLPTRKIGRIV